MKVAICLLLVAVFSLAACPPGGPSGPVGPSQGCQACLDSSGCNGDPTCGQQRCGFVCGPGYNPQSMSNQCSACTQQCGGASNQCYQDNCTYICSPSQACQSCIQQDCWDYNSQAQVAACAKQACGSVCNASPIDAGAP
jgi:hypothetical protein